MIRAIRQTHIQDDWVWGMVLSRGNAGGVFDDQDMSVDLFECPRILSDIKKPDSKR